MSVQDSLLGLIVVCSFRLLRHDRAQVACRDRLNKLHQFEAHEGLFREVSYSGGGPAELPVPSPANGLDQLHGGLEPGPG